MTKYTAEFTDVNRAADGNSRPANMVVDEPGGQSGGWLVSKKKGLLLALTCLIVVMAVGVAVHFITKNKMRALYIASENDNHEGLKTTVPPGGGITTLKPSRPVDVRLPQDLHPIHYNVELRPDFYGTDTANFRFTGLADIYMRCEKSTQVIVIHSKNLTVAQENISVALDTNDTQTTAAPVSGDVIRVVNLEEDFAREWLKIYLDKSLQVGSNYVIKMSFNAPLTDSLSGLYLSSYKENNRTRWLVTSDLEPTDARRILPCFDEPAFKATFNVTLLRRRGYTALSNMPVLETIILGDGEWQADVFQKSPKMSTYLLAFIISDFQNTFGYTRNQQLFRVFTRREALSQTQYAAEKGVAMHNYFENFFNVSYPLPKQDLIAIPDFSSGAMENWGLITFRETALLYDSAASSIVNKQRVATVISHELAHQWFGNLVSPAWWDDLWLNEGFASYVEYLGVNNVEPTWNMMDLFVLDDLHRALSLDSLSNSHPIYQPVRNPDEIREIFDAITYSKGASVIRMMHSFLGSGTFRRGLTLYLLRHQYRNANHNDLWTALTEQSRIDGSNIDVGDVMNTWIKQMGYPLVTVSRDNNTLTLTQKHFLLYPVCKHHIREFIEESPYRYRWKIPFTYTFGPSANWSNPTTYWMMDPTGNETVNLSDNVRYQDWLIGNVNQFGYYRVNYDMENWMKLLDQLKRNHTKISLRNRAQLLDDALFIGRASIIDQILGLRLAQYLVKENDYLPWKAVSRHLYFIESMLERTDVYGNFQKFVIRLIQPIYDRFNASSARARQSEPHNTKLLRSLITELACDFGHRDCLSKMSRQYRDWMNAPNRNQINPDMRSKVYCHAVREGGLEEWEFAYSQYKVANVAVEKDRLLSAMSCSRYSWILSRYINLAWKTLPKQDTMYTLARISTEPAGRPLVWNFFRQYYPDMKKKFGELSFAFDRLFGSLTSAFNTEVELKELKQFKAENPDISMKRAYDQALEKTRLQISWLNTNENKLREWLNEVTQ